jgi:hypothetical protein
MREVEADWLRKSGDFKVARHSVADSDRYGVAGYSPETAWNSHARL